MFKMLNTLRRPLSTTLRTVPTKFPRPRYASASPRYVPPSAKDDVEDRQDRFRKEPPSSPTFYTARSEYYDQLQTLETAIQFSRRSLSSLELLPLPAFARASLPPARPAWRTRLDMAEIFSTKLTTGRYRRVTKLLNQLDEYHRIAQTAGHGALATGIFDIISLFERKNKRQFLEQSQGKRKAVKFDRYGRTLTVGARKTSSAKAWMIPVQSSASPESSSTVAAEAEEESAPFEAAYATESSIEDPLAPDEASREKVDVTVSTILVNNIPLNEYFRKPHEREQVVRPLKLAGVLGAYNIFALCRGGGTSGQAGAVGHAIARGVVAHVPEMEQTMRKGAFDCHCVVPGCCADVAFVLQRSSSSATRVWWNGKRLVGRRLARLYVPFLRHLIIQQY